MSLPAFLSAPRTLSAAAISALGLVDLTVGVVVPHAAPIIFWPLTSLRGTLAALACGLARLLLGRGLARGLRAAWALTLVLLLLATLAAPIDHDDWAVLALLPVAALWLRRRDFTCRPVPPGAATRGCWPAWRCCLLPARSCTAFLVATVMAWL